MSVRRAIALTAAVVITVAAGIAWWSRPGSAPVETNISPATATDGPLIAASLPAGGERPTRSAARPAEESSDLSPGAAPVAASSTAVSEGLREQWRAEIALLYEDVGERVGLDGAETNALHTMLLDHRVRYAEADFGEAGVAQVAARKEFSRQLQREIEARIGRARATSLATYEKSIEARMYVDQLRGMLERASVPLSETQRKTLIRQSIERGLYLTGPGWTGVESELAMMQEMQAKSDLRDQGFSTLARGVLHADQFERYEAWTATMREASDGYMRAQQGAAHAR